MKKSLLLVFAALSVMISAQKLNVVSGSFDFLKGQKEVNVKVTFDDMKMMAENLTEEQYLENRKRDILDGNPKNEDEWKKWSEDWQQNKTRFADDFAKGLSPMKNIVFGKDLPSKYTLIVETKWLYPGWYGGMMMQPAKLTSVLKFVETDNPTQVLLQLEGDKIDGIGVKGRNLVMEYGRVALAYQKTGKLLMKEISKNLKK